jgi:hypothetical protein
MALNRKKLIHRHFMKFDFNKQTSITKVYHGGQFLCSLTDNEFVALVVENRGLTYNELASKLHLYFCSLYKQKIRFKAKIQ